MVGMLNLFEEYQGKALLTTLYRMSLLTKKPLTLITPAFEEYAIAIDAQMKYSKRKGKLNKQVF